MRYEFLLIIFLGFFVWHFTSLLLSYPSCSIVKITYFTQAELQEAILYVKDSYAMLLLLD